METTAEETDGGFVLHGSKTWISNSPIAYVGRVIVLNLILNCLTPQRHTYHLGTVQVGW
jgi:alkylation response protein AidB-like acyl-CoA dehydrogenase